uniref:BRCT domain-containing protein n=2 Tax=Clytia hemisphaerica TaxID=252671 RepID=A0A7M5V0R0_9CNID
MKFQLRHQKYLVVPSSIKKSEQKQLLEPVSKLGGRLVKEWNAETTHLVMTKIIFTIKVVYALACGKHIVTPKFFEDILDCCDKKLGKKLPDEKNYLPVIQEQSMINMNALFYPNQERSQLFVGKIFVTLSATQHSRLKHAIQYSGGSMILQESREQKILKSISTSQTMVMALEGHEERSLSKDQSKWMKELQNMLSTHGLRGIGESEIGLALINNSLEKYCNPASKNVNVFCTTTDTQALSQQQSQLSEMSQVMLLPISHNKPSSSSTESKRKRNESEEDDATSKKPKMVADPVPGNVTKETNNKNNTSKNIINLDHEDDDFMFNEMDFSNFSSKKDDRSSNAKNTKTTTKDDAENLSMKQNGNVNGKKTKANGALNSSNQGNLIDIEDDDFLFDETAITKSFTSPRKQITVKSPQKKGAEVSPPKQVKKHQLSLRSPVKRTTRGQSKSEESPVHTKKKPESKNIINIDDDDFDFDESDVTGTFNSPLRKPASNLRNNVISKLAKNFHTGDTETATVVSQSAKENSMTEEVFIQPQLKRKLRGENSEILYRSVGEEEPTASKAKRKSKRSNDASVIAKNSELLTEKTLISPDNFSRKIIPETEKTLISPDDFSRRVVPETGPNVTTNFGDDDFDSEPNPFAFDVPKTKTSKIIVDDTPEKLFKDTPIKDITQQDVSDEFNDTEHNNRFMKAVCSSQASDLNDCVDLDEANENFETPDPVSLQTPVGGERLITPSYANKDTLISEEFPMAKKQNIILEGWLTTTCKITSSLLKSEDDPDLIGIPRDLMQTSFKSLVAKNTSAQAQQRRTVQTNYSNPKNTKLFRKQFVLSESSRRHMIGRDEMEIYLSQQAEDNDLFSTFRVENDREERDQRKITQMFARV